MKRAGEEFLTGPFFVLEFSCGGAAAEQSAAPIWKIAHIEASPDAQRKLRKQERSRSSIAADLSSSLGFVNLWFRGHDGHGPTR
jgi:hypothetical protein